MEPPPKVFLQDTLPKIKAERHAIQSKAKAGVS